MFWERLANLCKKKNVSPNAVAKIIGISNATCTKWKSGVIPNGETLIKLANYFDCSVDYLLGRTENTNSHKLPTERTGTIMGQYVFRLNVDESFDANLSNNEIKKLASLRLNYGWKLIELNEEKNQRFLILEWVKEGRPNIDPFGSNATKIESSELIITERNTNSSTPNAKSKSVDISAYTQKFAAATGAEGLTEKKIKEVEDFARQVAELEGQSE